jgi:pimeloyl-ACP methyl ester carboxylesterase
VASPGVAGAKTGVPALKWADCGDGFQCATATVPLSYANPFKGTTKIALIRKVATDPSQRIGSLFTNPGGPGGGGNDFVRATAGTLYKTLNTRYDIVGFDPRGTGESGQLDCKVNQETDGIYSEPFTTPENLDVGKLVRKQSSYVNRCIQLNRRLLPYVTTGNVVRDLDLLRSAVGDAKLNYLGFSYGTFIGATYGSLFPGKLGHVVLDGPVDANAYINDPMADLSAQTSAFEREFGRFLTACAVDQEACLGFGGTDPLQAFDDLVRQANITPLPADGNTDDPRPVTGDDILNATIGLLYNKKLWKYLAQDLALAQSGDGSGFRFDVDDTYGYDPETKTYDPGTDAYFLIGAIDQDYDKRNINTYLRAGKQSYDSYDHFWFNNGYIELNYGLFNVKPDGVFRGPFKIPAGANTPLVVATTYDPATPYRGAKALVRDLGNARLLTMDGDNHTAYGNNSPCIDAAVNAYLFDATLPADGTRCKQEVPFAQPAPAPAFAPQAKAVGGIAASRPERVGGIHQKAELLP